MLGWGWKRGENRDRSQWKIRLTSCKEGESDRLFYGLEKREEERSKVIWSIEAQWGEKDQRERTPTGFANIGTLSIDRHRFRSDFKEICIVLMPSCAKQWFLQLIRELINVDNRQSVDDKEREKEGGKCPEGKMSGKKKLRVISSCANKQEVCSVRERLESMGNEERTEKDRYASGTIYRLNGRRRGKTQAGIGDCLLLSKREGRRWKRKRRRWESTVRGEIRYISQGFSLRFPLSLRDWTA